jgi:hypothetical protein
MEKQPGFQFPILTVEEVKPLLQKDGQVFASEIKGRLASGQAVSVYENRGLDLTGCIGRQMECLLEITRGWFEYPDQESTVSGGATAFRYQWYQRAAGYFPELVKLQEDFIEAGPQREDAAGQAFEKAATELFRNWGLNGLNIGIYQAKPVLHCSLGFFLLNEYVFEEEIEELEAGEEIYIRMKELYLRGIRPFVPEGEMRQEEEEVAVPEEPPPRTKSRISFSID